ncbi:MAG: hypothetical protein ACL7AY_15590 [Candidatus Arsenophonus phytopathogenicus]
MNPTPSARHGYEQQQEIAYWGRQTGRRNQRTCPASVYDRLPSSVMRKPSNEDFDDIRQALFDHFKNEHIHRYSNSSA